MNRNRVLTILSALFIFASCAGEEEQPVNLKWRPVVDSAFAAQKPDIERKADSVCLLLRDSVFNATFDSILHLRMEEIQKITQ